jgi:hypothetical protein
MSENQKMDLSLALWHLALTPSANSTFPVLGRSIRITYLYRGTQLLLKFAYNTVNLLISGNLFTIFDSVTFCSIVLKRSTVPEQQA